MTRASATAGGMVSALALGLIVGPAVAATRQHLSGQSTSKDLSDAELFSGSPEHLRQSLMPNFTGEIVDSDWRNMHPGTNKIVTLYEPMIPISPSVCRQATHVFVFRESWDRGTNPGWAIPNGRVQSASYDGAIYLVADQGQCVTPSNGDRGFDSQGVDVSETIAKYQAALKAEAPQTACDKVVPDCPTLFKSMPLASLRSLYGCQNADCVAEFDFPDPGTGNSPWGWIVKLYDTGGVYQVDIRRAYPPAVS